MLRWHFELWRDEYRGGFLDMPSLVDSSSDEGNFEPESSDDDSSVYSLSKDDGSVGNESSDDDSPIHLLRTMTDEVIYNRWNDMLKESRKKLNVSVTVSKASTLPKLRAALELDCRQDVETSQLCKSLVNLFSHGIPIDAIYNAPPPMMFTADLTELWTEWVNSAKVYHDRQV